jgi:signal transduction histidine kinase
MRKDDRTTLEFAISEPGLEIFADQNLISQVLINLVKNALEALEDSGNGKITISASKNQDNKPEICISDNGPGIPPENIDKIFVPFFTTRQTGSGIGLSVSRQIMRMHGGSLKVRSKPFKETHFCLIFNRT